MLKNILSNTYVNIAALLAVPSAFLADVFGTPIAYAIAFILILGLLIYGFFDEKKKLKLYSAKTIHLPIVFNISNPANSKSALNSLFKILEEDFPNHQENLKKYLSITESDLIYEYNADIFDEERFIDFLKITKHDIKQLQQKAQNNTHLHLVYIGPIANAIAIGTILGTDGVTVYQYNKSTDSYTISLEIKDREYKQHEDEFTILKKESLGEIKDGDTITVAIELSSHKVALEKLQKPIIYLKSTLGATITNPKDFIKANKEIYAVLNELQQKTVHIKLIYSMPISIALLLGMAIQNYWDVELTQYFEGEYKTVIKHLNKIKYYF